MLFRKVQILDSTGHNNPKIHIEHKEIHTVKTIARKMNEPNGINITDLKMS